MPKRLLRLSEVADHPILSGTEAAAYPKAECDRLLNCRVLVELEPASEWPVCDACECDLDARPIHRVNGKIVAPCPLDARSDAELVEDDLRAFELDVTTLIETLAADNDIADRPSRLLPGLWHLGSVGIAGGNRRVLFFARALTQDLLDAVPGMIKTVARTDPATLLVPASLSPVVRRRLEEAGIAIVVAEDVLADDTPTKPFRLDPARLVPKPAADPRLRIDRAIKRIRLDGVDLFLSPRSFGLLVALAEENETLVSRRSIEDKLWNTIVSKKAVADAVNKLKRELVQVGIAQTVVEALIENQRSVGYRLVLPSHDLLIVD